MRIVADRRARRRLERGEIIVERAHVVGHAFRQQDAVRAAGDRGGEIVERETARQRVDPDIAADAVRPVRFEELAGQPPRGRTVRGGDRVLEIEDQRVGAGFETARELALAIGRDEQQRAHRVSGGDFPKYGRI